MDVKEFAKMSIDGYRGSVQQYSVQETQDTIRKALVEANNGSETLDYRAIRDGKCSGLFALIETLLDATVVEGLRQDDFFNTLVDYRNIAEGDKNLFITEDNMLFTVDEVANGTQAVRRQRLDGKQETSIPTKMHMVRIYEELNRVLAGRVDFNHMISKVAESFEKQILTDIFALWSGVTAAAIGGTAYFPVAGAYSEDALLDVVAHVEAAADGRQATIIGTKKALKPLMSGIVGTDGKNFIDNNGYVGKWYGSNVFAMPQRHQVGTTLFQFPNNVLTIVAGDDKPIKFVYEGDPLVIPGNPADNMDLTQEYLYGVKYGTGLVLAGGNSGIGIYTTTASAQ